MSITIFGMYEVLLVGSFFLGLVLLAIGVALLITMKNKIIGLLTTAFGLVITVLPIFVILFLTVTTSVRG